MKQTKIHSPSYTVCGLDPGITRSGYGLIKVVGTSMELLQFGLIPLDTRMPHEARLGHLLKEYASLFKEYAPQEVAIEAPFYGKNVQSMLKLGRAQGMAMASAWTHNATVYEYSPTRIKKAVTGSGSASKEQVARMLMQLLAFSEMPKHLDATDALAVAVCHALQQRFRILK